MKNIHVGLGSLLNAVFKALVANPIIFYPFFVLGFIQFLLLEIIYFIPRYPLSELFGPIIVKTAGPVFLHYPYNYLLLFKWFHGVEVFIAIFISCIFYGALVLIISLVDSGKPVDLRQVFRQVFSSYIHLAAAMILAVILFQSLIFLLGLVLKRALLIRSTVGVYFLIKRLLIISFAYLQFLSACIVTTLFAFVVPIIMLEQKKIIAAVKLNFTQYSRLFGLIIGVVITSGVLYLPFIFLRSIQTSEMILKAPEVSGLFLALSVLMMLLISVIQYTAVTLCYLLVKEVPL